LDISAGTASLSGVVTEGGVPAVGGSIECYVLSETGITFASTDIEADGSYRIEDVSEGVCALDVSYDRPDGSRVSVAPGYRVVVQEYTAHRFDIDGAEVGGVLIHTGSYDPETVHGVLLPEDVAVSDLGDGLLGEIFGAGIGRDESGVMMAPHVVPGRYHVALVRSEDDVVVAVAPVVVRAGEVSEVGF
jgi:hypothetical protein